MRRFSAKTLPISVEDLPSRLEQRGSRPAPIRDAGAVTLRDMEMQVIHRALERNAGNKPKAAEELGISLKTLYNKAASGKQPGALGVAIRRAHGGDYSATRQRY